MSQVKLAIQTLLCLLLFPVFFQSQAQSGSELLRRHFEKTGQELWDQIGTVSVDGRWVDENYYGYEIKLTYKAPEKIRIQGKYDRKTFIEAYNGLYAWIVAPWKTEYKVQLMTPEEAAILKNSFHLGSPLYPHREDLKFKGLEDFEGTVYHAFILDNDREKRTYYLGKSDHQLHVEEIELKTIGFQVVKYYEKYQSHNGLSLPTAVWFKGENLEKELIFEEVVVGIGAGDNIFDMPEKK